MERLRTICFASISLCALLLTTGCSTSRRAGSTGPGTPLHLERTSRYQVRISTPGGLLTGILILRRAGSEWRGSLVNEFGLKTFDLFSSAPNRCRLSNVMPMLDKWYIRRTLEGDLAFLLWQANEGLSTRGRKVDRLPGGAFALVNTRRRIEYAFYPLKP